MNLLPFGDGILLAIVLIRYWPRDFSHELGFFLWTLLAIPLIVKFYWFLGLYESKRVNGLSGVLRSLLAANLSAGIVLALLLTVVSSDPPYLLLLKFLAVSTCAILLGRWTIYFALHIARRRGFDVRNVCVLGNWEGAQEVASRFAQHSEWGFRVVCVGEGLPGHRSFRKFPNGALMDGDLEEILLSHVIDEVLISAPPEELRRELPTFALCTQYGLLTRFVPDMRHHAIQNVSVQDLCGEFSLAVGRPCGSFAGLLAKRSIDIVLSTLALVALSPLLLLITLSVKLSSPGRVIFRQQRTGLHGRKFTLYKFRTMVDGAEAMLQSVIQRNVMNGPIFKDPTDPRITSVGRTLRRFSLDELPQLVNVLMGDMSLVGPRPLPLYESSAIRGDHRRRLTMRPGLTCLWQINGRSSVDYSTWMKYDLQYVDGWSLWTDLKVIVRTIPLVVTGKGAC